jgi:hypothetical protein
VMGGRRVPFRILAFLILGGCSESAFQVVDSGGPSSAALAEAVLQAVAGDGQEAEVATVLPRALTVDVVDKWGNPLPSAPVRWSFSAGQGLAKGASASSSLTTRTDASGRASVDWQLGTRSGEQKAWAEIDLPDGPLAPAADAGLGPQGGNGKRVGFRARGQSAGPAEIRVSHAELEIEEGEAVGITAVVVDRYGNVVEGAEVTFSSSDESIVTVDQSSDPFATGLATPALASAAPVEMLASPDARTEVPFFERVWNLIQ